MFDPRYQTVHVVPFLIGAFEWAASGRKRPLTEHYFRAFLRMANPSLVLTTIDNSETFYSGKLYRRNNTAKFVAIQNGCRWVETMPQSAMNLGPDDTIVCLTHQYVDAWRAVAPRAKILPLGTFASKRQLSEPASQAKHVAFLSTWKIGHFSGETRLKSTHFGTFIPHSQFYSPEIDLLPRLISALKPLGLRLQILARSTGVQSKAEESFYREILGAGGWDFIRRVGSRPNYENIWRYEMLFCVTTTLAYEALTLGQRVMFLEVSPVKTGSDGTIFVRQPFGYPNTEASRNSPLHLLAENSSAWTEQISNLLSMTERAFELEVQRVVGKAAVSATLADLKALVQP